LFVPDHKIHRTTLIPLRDADIRYGNNVKAILEPQGIHVWHNGGWGTGGQASNTVKGLMCTNTSTLGNWLNFTGTADVIHFNFGLHDLEDPGVPYALAAACTAAVETGLLLLAPLLQQPCSREHWCGCRGNHSAADSSSTTAVAVATCPPQLLQAPHP